MKNISNIRREYSSSYLKKDDLNPNPYLQFNNWFDDALKSDILDPTAFTLSTIDENGLPDSRIVLLKDLKYDGFCVFTNYNSKKGRHLESKPYATLNFYWDKLDRQVIIKSKACKMKEEDAEEYFSSRPRESQITALISNQSEIVKNRESLTTLFEEKKKALGNQPIPKPLHWGGFLFIGFEYTFWQGRKDRLHDVFRYIKGNENNNNWDINRVAP